MRRAPPRGERGERLRSTAQMEDIYGGIKMKIDKTRAGAEMTATLETALVIDMEKLARSLSKVGYKI